MLRPVRLIRPRLVAFVGACLAFTSRASRVNASGECTQDAAGLPADYGAIINSFPVNNASGVPRDGIVRVRYRIRAPSRPFVIVADATTRAVVSGTLSVLPDELIWQSDRTLAVSTRYQIEVADPVGTGSQGSTFTTSTVVAGRGRNVTFAGLTDASAQRQGSSDPCGDANAARITLEWRTPVIQAWTANDVDFVVYQTSGPGISGPIERARFAMANPPSGTCSGVGTNCTSFRLSSDIASGAMCFNLQVLDPYGTADGNAVEKCVSGPGGAIFLGCAVTPRAAPRSRRHTGFPMALLVVVGAVTVARRFRQNART